jgi:ABC-type multidrug transport system ATPase subunit
VITCIFQETAFDHSTFLIFIQSKNLVTYVDQLDQHHEYLTVRETLQYSFDCLRGTHKSPYIPHNSTNDAIIAEMDKNYFAVNIVLEALGLKRVKDTYVGNDVSVRGVSGGERKRVTLGELLSVGAPVFCFDEISTGRAMFFHTFPRFETYTALFRCVLS